jgi:carboxyl-terminal processing protease
MNKKICHGAANAAVIFCLVVFASQCFAQSPSVSAKEAADSTLKYLKIINGVFNYAQQNYVDEVDPKILYEGAMKGMLEALGDPYTLYLDSESMRDLTDTTAGNFGGVGLSITKLLQTAPDKPAYVEVVSPIENTPGFKAGIQSGDYITAIDGTPTPELTMNEVLAKLRGTVGTTVEVSILRGKNIQFKKTLVRALIEVPTVKYAMIDTIGYLRIIQFTPETPRRVQEGIDYFKQKKLTGLVIDLRNNPGGLITSAVDVADKFIDTGTIVSTKSRLDFQNTVFTASPEKTTVPPNMPIVVLINKGSASAAEILSGALKDDHLAYLVGQNTYGKGSVQQLVPLSEDDGIKITMARYYTPSDTNIDKVGIPPDREVLFPVLTEEEEKVYENLIKADTVTTYVAAHQNMSEKDIVAYAQELQKTYKLDLRTLRRIIRLEVYRPKGGIQYDLDYDVQLNAALAIVKKEDFQALMKMTKTLKDLQKDAQKAAALAAQTVSDKKITR